MLMQQKLIMMKCIIAKKRTREQEEQQIGESREFPYHRGFVSGNLLHLYAEKSSNLQVKS